MGNCIMAMDNVKNTLHGWYKSTVEYVTPHGHQ